MRWWTSWAAAKDRGYCISMQFELQTEQEHPENNIICVSTMPKLERPMRSSSRHHQLWKQQRRKRPTEREPGDSHRLSPSWEHNNFQAIKEVIKHTQHREGVSLMRILTAGGGGGWGGPVYPSISPVSPFLHSCFPLGPTRSIQANWISRDSNALWSLLHKHTLINCKWEN